MKYILYPCSLGQLKKGVSNTPNILKRFVDPKNVYNVNCTNNIYKNLNRLYIKNSKLRGKRINIGGDHSMSIATVGYSLNKVYNLKVIWFDAHPDINTSYSTSTNNIHGMPLGFLTGLDYNPYFHFIKNFIKFENILYIGLRDIDKFEKNILNICKIKSITCDEVNNNPEIALLKINQFINSDSFHLSFDVDCMDPSVIKSTGTPVNNGIKLQPMKMILNDLMNKNNMINMDITELNMDIGSLDEKKKSLTSLLHLIDL